MLFINKFRTKQEEVTEQMYILGFYQQIKRSVGVFSLSLLNKSSFTQRQSQ